jgi:signal transduction histidine kinase
VLPFSRSSISRTELPRAVGHGLLGMRYRVEAEGGRMRLETAPGKGVLIEAQLPAQVAQAADEAAEAAPAPAAAAERPSPATA